MSDPSKLNFYDNSNLVSYVKLKNISDEKLEYLLITTNPNSDEVGRLYILQTPHLRLVYEQQPHIIELPIEYLRVVEKIKCEEESTGISAISNADTSTGNPQYGNNLLLLKFYENEMFDYTVELEFPSQYTTLYFLKTFLTFIKAYDPTYIPPPVNQFCEDYQNILYNMKKKTTKKSSFTSISQSTNTDLKGSQFFAIRPDEWDPEDFEEWMKNEYIEVISAGKNIMDERIRIFSLFEVFNQQKLMNLLREYLKTEGKNIFVLHKELSETLCNSKPRKKQNNVLRILVSEYRPTMNHLFLSLDELKNNNWVFNIQYALVLRKLISLHLENKPRRNNSKSLRFIKTNLLITESYKSYWHIPTLKNRLLSLLLFGMGVDDKINQLETEFLKFLQIEKKKNNKEKEENEGESEEEEEEEEDFGIEKNKNKNNEYSFTPEFYVKCLKKFNQKHLVHLHQISFRTMIELTRMNNFKQKKKILDSQESNECKIGKLTTEIKNLKNEKIIVGEKIRKLTDDMILSETEEGMAQAEEDLKKQEDFSRNIELRLIRVKEDLEKMRDSKKIKSISEMNQKIENFNLEDVKVDGMLEQRIKFLNHPRRMKYVEEMIRSNIQILENNNNNKTESEETKKRKEGSRFNEIIEPRLVLARTYASEPTKLSSGIMSVFDPLLKPKFFQFGFLHSGISIYRKNIVQDENENKKNERFGFSLNWFSSSLVNVIPRIYLGNPYDEIIHLHGICSPILLNYKTLESRMHELAQKVVFFNFNYEYSDFNLYELKGRKINCQEVTENILNLLNYGIFKAGNNLRVSSGKAGLELVNNNNLIKKWIERIKSISKDSERIKDEVRILFVKDINDEIRSNLKKGWFSKKEKEKKKNNEYLFEIKFKKILSDPEYGFVENNQIITFMTHSHLDEFYKECRRIDPDFEFNYPQVCRLLKSFDEGFWIQHQINKEIEFYQESEDGCPFCK